MEDAESLAQGAVERLSEDESLRGDLTDDGFSPLLDWAANAAIAYAQNLKSDKPDEAMDAYASRLKSVMQEAVADAQAGKLEDPAALLDFEMAQPEAARAKLATLKLEANKADDNAIKIAGLLSEALNAAPASGSAATPEEKPAPAPVPEKKPEHAAKGGDKAPEKQGESLPSLEKHPKEDDGHPSKAEKPEKEGVKSEKSEKDGEPHHHAGKHDGVASTSQPGAPQATAPENKPEPATSPVSAPPAATQQGTADDGALSKLKDAASESIEKSRQFIMSFFSKKQQ